MSLIDKIHYEVDMHQKAVGLLPNMLYLGKSEHDCLTSSMALSQMQNISTIKHTIQESDSENEKECLVVTKRGADYLMHIPDYDHVLRVKQVTDESYFGLGM